MKVSSPKYTAFSLSANYPFLIYTYVSYYQEKVAIDMLVPTMSEEDCRVVRTILWYVQQSQTQRSEED